MKTTTQSATISCIRMSDTALDNAADAVLALKLVEHLARLASDADFVLRSRALLDWRGAAFDH